MYKQISIENLKIFKDEQELKIAPITLLYGENSSGKTSLLKTFDIVHNIFSEQLESKLIILLVPTFFKENFDIIKQACDFKISPSLNTLR